MSRNLASIGKAKQCKSCLAVFAHYGINTRLCKPCYLVRARKYWSQRKQDPSVVAMDRSMAKARRARKKQEVLNYLKTCRCETCRENNPLALRIFKPDGKMWQVSIYHRTTKLSVFRLKSLLKDHRISCLNCWAAAGGRVTDRMIGYSA